MIKIVEDNILNAKEKIIGHQTNCYRIKSGVALDIITEYKNVKYEFDKIIKEKNNDLLGEVQLIDCGKHIIANIFGQKNYGYDSKKYTDYYALRKGLDALFKWAKLNNLSVALPYKIGCCRGGGKWEKVVNIIESLQKRYNIDVTLYKFNKNEMKV